MKKLTNALVLVLIGSASMGSVASAATCQGSITLTGAGSNNTVSCSDISNIVVDCNNNIVVATANQQTGSSGGASAGGNTSSGNVASGSVVNDNGQDITVGAACDSSPATTTTDTPETPGKGAFRPPSLPVTSGAPSIVTLASGAVLAGAIISLVRLAVLRVLRQS